MLAFWAGAIQPSEPRDLFVDEQRSVYIYTLRKTRGAKLRQVMILQEKVPEMNPSLGSAIDRDTGWLMWFLAKEIRKRRLELLEPAIAAADQLPAIHTWL